MAEELESGDPDVLESFYALQIEVEQLRQLEDTTAKWSNKQFLFRLQNLVDRRPKPTNRLKLIL